LEDLLIDEPVRAGAQPEKGTELIGLGAECALFPRLEFRDGDDLGLANLRCVEALLPDGGALGRTGVGRNLADAQMIVLEPLEAAFLLEEILLVSAYVSLTAMKRELRQHLAAGLQADPRGNQCADRQQVT